MNRKTNGMNRETNVNGNTNSVSRKKKKKRLKRRLIKLGMLLMLIGIMVGCVGGTKAGRKILYKLAAYQIHNSVEEKAAENKTADVVQDEKDYQKTREELFDDQEPVLNFLIFGVEEIAGDRNTDSMLVASVNWKTGTIKLTSLMRDTYVEIPGYRKNKLNAAFANGGVPTLINTVEQNYKIHINGYAYVNFDDFENIIDLVGGIPVTLTGEEAHYLNTTNYISKRKYRTVTEGMNYLNGNQVLGYCRVRHVRTSTKTYDDYGRTERQRKVLSTIFSQCKNKNMFDLITIAEKSLKYIKTDISEREIECILETVVEKHADHIETCRIPAEGLFTDPRKFEGITYPLILDWDKNISKLYQFIYDDTEEEAQNRLNQWNSQSGTND